jgi:hypothetical protein
MFGIIVSTKPVFFFKFRLGVLQPGGSPLSQFRCQCGDRDVSATSTWPALDPTQLLYQSRLLVRWHPSGGDPSLNYRAPLSPGPNAEDLDLYRNFALLALYRETVCEVINSEFLSTEGIANNLLYSRFCGSNWFISPLKNKLILSHPSVFVYE